VRGIRAKSLTSIRPKRCSPQPSTAPCTLTDQYERQGLPTGDAYVFASKAGTQLDRHNVLRAFRPVIEAAGLNPAEWTPRELRHSFVSLLSDNGMSLEEIADLCPPR
jgi:site-specific recombinase XerD